MATLSGWIQSLVLSISLLGKKWLGKNEVTFSVAILIYPVTCVLQASNGVKHDVCVSLTSIHLWEQIIPQSICSRYGLAIGATVAPVVRVLVWICIPVAYPISKVWYIDLALAFFFSISYATTIFSDYLYVLCGFQLLDFLLGHGHVALFRRAELKTLVDMHGNEVRLTALIQFHCQLSSRTFLYSNLICFFFFFFWLGIYHSKILSSGPFFSLLLTVHTIYPKTIWLSCSRLEKVESWHMMRQQLLPEHLSSPRKQLVMPWLL